MVRVVVEARLSKLAISMDCNEHELEYFLIDHRENSSRAREYLIKLHESGNFEDTVWGPEIIEEELEITVEELGLSYVIAKEETELLQKKPSAQLQKQPNRGKVEATMMSIDGGEAHSEVPVVNIDEISKETPTALEDQVRSIYLWSDNATKYLISAFKERKELFCSKSVKKSALWKEITTQLTLNGFGNPTAVQVEDKFKNLRRLYAKIKDSMGPNASGQPAPNKFKYYDDMQEIFSKNPQYDPPFVIGSRRPRDHVDDVENNERKKTPKTNMLQTVLESQNERHREILKEIITSRQIFADKLDKLIEKL